MAVGGAIFPFPAVHSGLPTPTGIYTVDRIQQLAPKGTQRFQSGFHSLGAHGLLQFSLAARSFSRGWGRLECRSEAGRL